MALPAPNLDDRRFQQLVDDAKRYVQQHCPEWTDHNVSDPGVTLIELFASMVDQVLYRLNRVPDRNYLKFLDLIGISLFPPTAARTWVTFWLSAPQPEAVVIPAGTEVATLRTATAEAITFTTMQDLSLIPSSLKSVSSSIVENETRDHGEALSWGKGVLCFDEPPKPGDSLFVGLSSPVPSCAVALRFDCETTEGVGVNPQDPPWAWEAWSGKGWVSCEIDHDDTGGLNRSGDVILHVPAVHQSSVVGGQAAGWLRCRVTEAESGQPAYSRSPRINRLSAFTVGGTAEVLNAEVIAGEELGPSEGVPGQRFQLKRRPIVADEGPRVLEVAGEEGWQEWNEVATFADSGPDDRHFQVDPVAGEVLLGPAVRESDGALRAYGAVPGKGNLLRLRSYRTGGGRSGNVRVGALRVLKSSIPYITRVENRFAAVGGVDGEDVAGVKVRGPLILRSANRAVTVEDYEQLAREAAPEVARIRCVPTGDGELGAVRVLVVPECPDEDGRIPFERLDPSLETLDSIARYLDERRIIGARVIVEPPLYQGITVMATLRPRPRIDPSRLQKAALEALYRYFHPLRGGPDGDGWPFGRPVILGEVYSVLQAVPGTELVEETLLYPSNPKTGDKGKKTGRIELRPHELVFSHEHRIRLATVGSR